MHIIKTKITYNNVCFSFLYYGKKKYDSQCRLVVNRRTLQQTFNLVCGLFVINFSIQLIRNERK